MGAVLVPVILILVAVVAGVLLMKRFTRREVERSDRLQYADRPTLRYQVPTGQDPSVVLIALRNSGFEASADSEPGPSSPIVIVGARDGGEPDREAVRATIVRMDGTNVNTDESGEVERGPVVFEDEHPGRRA